MCQVGALTNDKMKEYIDVAQECKRYLKTDYKVIFERYRIMADLKVKQKLSIVLH